MVIILPSDFSSGGSTKFSWAWRTYIDTSSDGEKTIPLTSPITLSSVVSVQAQTVSSTINNGTSNASSSWGFTCAASAVIKSFSTTSCIMRYTMGKANATSYRIWYIGK